MLTSLGNIVPDLVPPPPSPRLSSPSCCRSGLLYISVPSSSLTGEDEDREKEDARRRERMKSQHDKWMDKTLFWFLFQSGLEKLGLK